MQLPSEQYPVSYREPNRMGSNDFDVELFEQRLANLKDTQEGIQQMSSWCLQQRAHHKKIVSSWLNVLKQVRVEHRLTLFHLANDVIQYSKRKNYEFVESWGTTLQKATTMVRDEKVRNKIFRILKIWEQRQIYSEEYLSDLNGLLSMNPVKKTQQSSIESGDDFQASILIANIKDCVRLEQHTDRSFKHLPKEAPNCDAESIKNTLKDRSRAEEVEKQLDEYVAALESYVKSLSSEIKCRSALVTNMDHGQTFYANQRGEVKVVVNAYKNFGNRIKVMKKKLEEIAPTLPSPIPSPDINAPSPEPDADIILPDEQNSICASMFKNSSNGYNSYMDTTLPFDINDFKRDSPRHSYDGSSSSTQPIQVINSRLEEKNISNFNMDDYFKPVNSGNAYPTTTPLPVPPVPRYERSQSGISSYSDSYSDGAYNPLDTPYTNDSNYLSSASSSYDGNMPLMPPPPMPPGLTGQNDDFSSWDLEMSWNSANSSNPFNHVIETPTSPPSFEREGVNTNVIEYVDRSREPVLSSVEDVDHRQLHLPPTANVPLSMTKEKGRSVDIDHRNLISLTGSPGPKLPNDIKKNETAIWSSEDKDLRPNLLHPFPVSTNKNIPLSSIDTDYRQQFPNIKDIPLDDSAVATPSMPVPPLEPPNFPILNEFLESPNQIDMSMPPPGIVKSDTPKNKSLSPQKNTGKPAASKGNGNDNVESIDMEMSDEDQEDPNRDLFEETEIFGGDLGVDSPPINDTATPAFSTPTQAPFRPPLLKTPDFPPSPNMPWENTKQLVHPNLGNNGTPELNASPINPWKSPRMTPPGIGGHIPTQPPPFRMPGNQSFLRGGFVSPPMRGFPPQMKQNFRSPLMRPPRNNSPYFNNRGRGAGILPPSSNPFRNPQNAFRGKFRGGGNW